MIHLLLSVFLAGSLVQAGPLIVGTGGGESEFVLILTRGSLPSLFSACQSGACKLSVAEKAILGRLIGKAQRPPYVKFLPSQQMTNALYRYEPSSDTVTFNRDLLWRDAQQRVPYDEPAAAALWARILAGMIGMGDVSHLENEIEKSLRSRTYSTGYDPQPGVDFRAYVWRGDEDDRLLIRDSRFNVYEFSKQLRDSANCTDGRKPEFVRLFSPRWSAPAPDSLNLDFMATWRCRSGAERMRMTLNARTRIEKGEALLIENTVRFFQGGQ